MVFMKFAQRVTLPEPTPSDMTLLQPKNGLLKVMKMKLKFLKLIRLIVDHSILDMVLHQRLHPCPDSRSKRCSWWLLDPCAFICRSTEYDFGNSVLSFVLTRETTRQRFHTWVK